MKAIDEGKLETDVEYRFAYLCEFIGFDKEAVSQIHGLAMDLAPLVPSLVEKTYAKLLSYDATAKHFVPRQHGFTGPTPANLDELGQHHAQIQFRKEHLTRYLMQILGHGYNARMIHYLDMVGKIHTDKAGNSEIVIPLVQMNALMGLLSAILTEAIFELGLDPEGTRRAVVAVNKLLWIQNDLINRHYAQSREDRIA